MKFNFTTVTTLISIVVGVIAVVLTYAQFSKKEVSYEIIYSIPAVNILKPINNHKFDVRIDDKKRESIYTTLIRVKNTGNDAIDVDDIVKPISIETNSEIYSFHIVDKMPLHSEPEISKKNNTINILFNLLNKGDWILVEIITTKHVPEFSISSRIKNAEDIVNRTNNESESYSTFYILLFSFFMLSISHTFIQESWLRRDSKHNILKFDKIPYTIVYASFIIGKYATLFVATWYFTTQSASGSLWLFFFIYGSTVTFPVIIGSLSGGLSWFTFPDNIAFQVINKKKKRNKRRS